MKKIFRYFSTLFLIFPFTLFSYSCSDNNQFITSEINQNDYGTAYLNFNQSRLGSSITNSMKITKVTNNNFGYFGGSDIFVNNYDLYQNNGYKTQAELLESFIKWNGPYSLLDGEFVTKKYTWGKRAVFDFSYSNYSLVDNLNIFDTVTKENSINTAVYNVDTVDIININKNNINQFKNNIKSFIDKSLSLNNNLGNAIIKTHYLTNNDNFNQKSIHVSNIIKNVIVENYWNDQNKLNRINLVDHANMTNGKLLMMPINTKFSEFCLTYNHNSFGELNAYGQLEMFGQTAKILFPDSLSFSSQSLTYNDLENNKIDHQFLSGNRYVSIYGLQQEKVKNFQNYLKSKDKANWFFLGDSLTVASFNTSGYKNYVDYLRYLIKKEFNRPHDLFINGATYGGKYEDDYNYPHTLFDKYNLDVMSVMLGTNDIAYIQNETKVVDYFKNYWEKTYSTFKAINPNGWLIFCSIPSYYNQQGTTTPSWYKSVEIVNQLMREFCDSRNDVLFIDTKYSFDYVLKNDFNNNYSLMEKLMAKDMLHFNHNGYVIFTKQIIANLGFDYSKSKFNQF